MNGRVVTLAAALFLASACESPRDTSLPPVSPERDGGGDASVVRGGGSPGGGMETDAPVMSDAAAGTDAMGLPPGSCTPGARRCGPGQTPELCSPAGLWTLEAACPFVCQGAGVCAGVCQPGSKRCGGVSGLVLEACDEAGRWIVGQACQNLCSSGSCAGTCMPGARRCGPNQLPEQCGPLGTWEPQAACAFICAGAGQCGGACKPGARQCLGKAPQVCNENGQWQTGDSCPFLCSGSGQCTGECVPGSRSCSGSTLRTCRSDARFETQACPGRSHGTPVCRNDACDHDCKDAKFPHRCEGGCCECERDADCAAMPDQVASCSAGACSYKAMCDLGRRTWTMTSASPCATSTWAFTRRPDGKWDAAETGCGNATGLASYDGTTIRLDFTYNVGAGRYTWPVDSRCAGGKGTLEFIAGPDAGLVYESTLTAN